MTAPYEAFLQAKVSFDETWGFDVADVDLHPILLPHQRDIVERLIRRFSSPGDLVHDPFAGVGTVPLVALQMGRRGSGAELNPGYWADSVGYLRAEEARRSAPTLFDLLDALGGEAS